MTLEPQGQPMREQVRYSSGKIVDVILAAGGEIVGQSRLRNITYLLDLTGLTHKPYPWQYKSPFGPWDEQYYWAVRDAVGIGSVIETKHATDWGGHYSVYTVPSTPNQDVKTLELAKIAAKADSIELDLVTTAVCLCIEGFEEPWEETQKRKSIVAKNGRIEKAYALHQMLSRIEVPKILPKIACEYGKKDAVTSIL